MIRSMRHKKQTDDPGFGTQAARRLWRKIFLGLLAGLLLIFFLSLDVFSTQAKPTKTPQSSGKSNNIGGAYDVIAAVNQLRAAKGLTPFNVNGALMSSAQGHSDYQASIHSITHSGSGGSDPKSRAIAAGFGGGATVFVSENIYGGAGASAQNAVNWWQGDSLHLNTMLGPNYTDAGAGVATDGNVVYFTLDVGYVAGSAGTGNNGSGYTPAPSTTVPLTPATPFYPVQVSTPGPDGSIIHIVKPGQSLWSIAASYKISLADLLKLNGLTNNAFIFPGDKLTIKPAGANSNPPPVATDGSVTPALGELPIPTATPRQPTAIVTHSPTQKPLPIQPSASSLTPAAPPVKDPLLLVIAGLVLGGSALMIAGNVLKRRG